MDVSFGDLLRSAREAAGLSQQELAERSGLTVNGIGQLERGVRTRPYPHTVRALADALPLDEAGRSRMFAAVPSRSRGPAAATPAPGALPRLPPLPTALVGRDAELHQVAQLLPQQRLITLTGPGGVGKTTLATAAALQARSGYPGGVAFVGLADVEDEAHALRTIAAAVGVHDAGAADVEQQLHTALQGQPRLLVLDNLEHLPGLAAPIGGLLAAVSEVTVLATSRAPLHLRIEHRIPIEPLPPPPGTEEPGGESASDVLTNDAVRLLLARANHDGHGLDAGDVTALATICRRTDGLPLAIELAAAWLRVLSPRELAERLQDALPLLVDGPRDLPDRHRTLRDAIAWSDTLLEPEARQLLRRLAVLPGEWNLETAAVVADRPELDVLRGVALLTERSLVHRAPDDRDGRTRFRLLETIRAYGRERLEADDDAEAARQRLTDALLEFLDQAAEALESPAQALWLGRVEDRLPDVRAVLRWALDRGHHDVAARAYAALSWQWYLRHATEGAAWGRELDLTQVTDEAVRGRSETALALVALAGADLATAVTFAGRAAERAEEVGDLVGAERALAVLANAAAAVGDEGTALAAAERLRRLTRDEGGSAAAEALASLAVARTALLAGDIDRAEALLTEVEHRLDRAPVPWVRVLWLNIAVMTDQLRDRHDRTMERLQECIALCRALGDAPALLYGLTSLAVELVLTDRYEAAARLFGVAERHGERSGQRISDPVTLQLVTFHRERVREQLGDDGFAEALARGRACTTDDALASLR